MLNGGTGTDTLKISDTTGVLNAARVAATVTNIENMDVDTAGRLGQETTAGTKQVNTYVVPTVVANVQQSNEYVFGTAAGVASQPFTVGTANASYLSSTTAATQAAAFVAAANAAVGSTVAFIGGTVAVNDAADSVNNIFTYDTISTPGILKVGMSVTGTSIPAGTTITAFTTTTITLSNAVTTGLADNAAITIGGGVAGVTILAPVAGTASPTIAFGAVASVGSVPSAALIVPNTDGNVGETVAFTYNGLPGTYVIQATADLTGAAFAAALNTVAGYTAAVNTTGSVAVTAATAGTALPTITFSGATGNIPSGTTTTANGVVGTTAVAYDVSGIALETFKASATDVINLKAKATTALDLTGTGAITVEGGGGASTMKAGGGAVSVGATSTVANGFTSVAVTGTSSTVGITDRSGLATDGVTVAVGTTLTSASITGNTALATIEGKGVTAINMSKSAGGLTVTNAATASHAMALGLSGVTAGTFTDATASSVAITTSASTLPATGNALTGITVAKAASITTAGTKSLNLGTISATKLETLTVGGAGGVTADVSSAGATTTAGFVTSVDTSTSTAVLSAANGTTANNITIGTSTAFTGGAGQDNLTVGASTKALTLGAGNDKLVLTAALSGTATVGGTADGGDGVDTLETTFAIAVAAGSSSGVTNAKISNFEKLSIVAGTLTTDVTVDFDYLPKINSYVKLGAFTGASSDVLTLANLANNATIELAGAFGSHAALAASIKDSGTSTTDVLNLTLASSDTLLAAGSVTANGIETINITSTNSVTATLPATRLDTLTLAADAVKTIVISGAAGLNLTNTNTTITSVDASGITGTAAQPNAFTFASGALTNATNAAITIKGTAAGINTIDMDSITNGLIAVTITVGGTVNVSANVFTGGAGIETVTGGSGADSFTMKEGRDVITTGAGNDKVTFAAVAVDRDTVTDFTAGVASAQNDKIVTANYTTAEYKDFTVASSAFTWTGANTTGHVVEFSFAANTTVNLGDNSADSLTGVNLLKSLNDGVTAATITLTTVLDTDVAYVVGYQGGNAYVYAVATGGTTSTIVGTELALVGVLTGVAVGALTVDNFTA